MNRKMADVQYSQCCISFLPGALNAVAGMGVNPPDNGKLLKFSELVSRADVEAVGVIS